MKRLLAAALCLFAARAEALTCGTVTFDGAPFTYCEADPRTDRIMMVWADDTGTPYGGFDALPEPARMAMNAGMFHQDLRPVGLFVEDHRQITPLVTRSGPGNFGMLPNGVFCIEEGRARVIETLRFAVDRPDCRYASQSGPMLVIGGDLHPRFLPDSTSRFIRNGVGSSADGTRVVFAISDAPVTFHHFARFFRDTMQTPDALYFDGNVSRLYAPVMGRDGGVRRLGPMVLVAE